MSGVIATNGTLLGRCSVVLSMNALLLAVLLTIVVVGVSVLVRGIVVGVVTRCRAESSMGGRLRGSGVNVIEGGLRYRCLLAERIKRLLDILRSSLAKSSVLLGVGRSSLGGYDKSSLVSS